MHVRRNPPRGVTPRNERGWYLDVRPVYEITISVRLIMMFSGILVVIITMALWSLLRYAEVKGRYNAHDAAHVREHAVLVELEAAVADLSRAAWTACAFDEVRDKDRAFANVNHEIAGTILEFNHVRQSDDPESPYGRFRSQLLYTPSDFDDRDFDLAESQSRLSWWARQNVIKLEVVPGTQCYIAPASYLEDE